MDKFQNKNVNLPKQKNKFKFSNKCKKVLSNVNKMNNNYNNSYKNLFNNKN